MQSNNPAIITSVLTTDEVEILTKVSEASKYDSDNFSNASEVLVDNDTDDTQEYKSDLLLLSDAKCNMLYNINEELEIYSARQQVLRDEIEELRGHQERHIDENAENDDFNANQGSDYEYNYEDNDIEMKDVDSDYLNDENIDLDDKINNLEDELVEVDDMLDELHHIHDKIYYTSF